MKKIIIMFLIVFGMVFNITFAETTTTALPDASVDTTSVIKQPLECINLTYSLKYKDKDINRKGEVTILQKFLKDKGYLNVLPTGYFGTLTLKAVKSFQKANGVPSTGLVGSITRGKIKASCTDGFSDLKVNFPNGGEQYKIGDKMQIKWTGPVVVGPVCPPDRYCAPPFLSYDITLINTYKPPCANNGCDYETPPIYIIKDLNNINEFEWVVGNLDEKYGKVLSGNYKIGICEKNRNICDTSDKTFSITDKETLCKNDGGVWYKGSNVCEINSLTESQCIAKGGKFNECASSCRHTHTEICTLECVQTCTFDFNI